VVVHSRTIGYLLNSLTDLEAIRVRAARYAAMQQIISATLPKSLSRQILVGYERRQTLVLLANNGMVAAKLRHNLPRVLLTIRKRFPEVTAIQIEVQLVHDSTARRPPQRRIGTTGLGSLAKLAAALPDGDLRAALTALVQRQRSHSENEPLENEKGQDDRSDREGCDEQTTRPGEPASFPSKHVEPDAPGNRHQDDKPDRAQ